MSHLIASPPVSKCLKFNLSFNESSVYKVWWLCTVVWWIKTAFWRTTDIEILDRSVESFQTKRDKLGCINFVRLSCKMSSIHSKILSFQFSEFHNRSAASRRTWVTISVLTVLGKTVTPFLLKLKIYLPSRARKRTLRAAVKLKSSRVQMNDSFISELTLLWKCLPIGPQKWTNCVRWLLKELMDSWSCLFPIGWRIWNFLEPEFTSSWKYWSSSHWSANGRSCGLDSAGEHH